MNGESYEWWAAQVAAEIVESETETLTAVPDEDDEPWVAGMHDPTYTMFRPAPPKIEDSKDTGELPARDNEAYRRDFSELEYNRWTDDGGSVVETTKFGDKEPSVIRFPEPQPTLREVLDESIDLEARVSRDQVRAIQAKWYGGENTVYISIDGVTLRENE